MSSDPSRPDSPIPDLDLEVGDWSGSEKDLASRPVETVVTTRGAGDSERGAFADTEHDVKEEAAENVNMGGTADQKIPRNSVRSWAHADKSGKLLCLCVVPRLPYPPPHPHCDLSRSSLAR